VIIQTTRFGEIEVPEDKIVTFQGGILGFSDYREYVLIDYKPGSPFRWLQSLLEPGLAFVVMDPTLLNMNYKVPLQEEEAGILQAQNTENLAVLAIVTIPQGQPELMTANLKGPIVINSVNRIAMQVILYDSAYSTRYPIYEVLSGSSPKLEATSA
jgi:flagellar assembly factor FliW